jgi:hypothetical protein
MSAADRSVDAAAAVARTLPVASVEAVAHMHRANRNCHI